MSKVTIIVPIYNVEEYVAKCLDSLLRQTYSDYVIYAVNDGSPKNEQPIIDRYAAAYPQKVCKLQRSKILRRFSSGNGDCPIGFGVFSGL